MNRTEARLDRRAFGRLAGASVLGAWAEKAVAATAQPAVPLVQPAPRARMKVGTQHGSSDEILTVLAALGVDHICSALPSARLDEPWSVEGLTRLRERVESFGIHLDMVPLPLSSHPIEQAENPGIMLGKSPRARPGDRRHLPDDPQRRARRHSRAQVQHDHPRGGADGADRRAAAAPRYSTFSYAKARQEPPLTEAGLLPADLYWERITYFLDRVIPVAEEHKVRLACHPHDPGMPPDKGYRGVHTVLGSVAGLKRFLEIRESPYHGLNFCQGTVAEMLEDPGAGDLRRDPLFRPPQEDLQRALPQHPGPLPRLPRDLPRRRRRGHARGAARLQGSRATTGC